MNRRAFVTGLGAVLAAPVVTEARRSATIHRIAYISPVGPEYSRFAGFQQGLRDLGYAEGQNISIEYRSSGGRFDRLAEIASDAAKDKFSVIVSHLTQASIAAKQATATVPIVMVGVADPVAAGLVTSLARPGAELPVEEPTKFELILNNRTAKALGLTIPPSLLRADQIIE